VWIPARPCGIARSPVAEEAHRDAQGIRTERAATLLAAVTGDNDLVELTRSGRVAAVKNVDQQDPPGGALFGLAASAHPRAVYFVNDDTSTLNILH
jgi:hypothetical protein